MIEYMIENGQFRPLPGCSMLSNHTSLNRVVGISEMTQNLTRCELRRALMHGEKARNSNWKPGCYIKIQAGQLVNEQGKPESPLILLIDGEWTVC